EDDTGLGVQPSAGGTLEVGEDADDDGCVRGADGDAGVRGPFRDRGADVHRADRIGAAEGGVEDGGRAGNGDAHERDGEGAWLHRSLLVSLRPGRAGRPRGPRRPATAAAAQPSENCSWHVIRIRDPSGIRYVPTSVVCTILMKPMVTSGGATIGK